MDYHIDSMNIFDWNQVSGIYLAGIKTGIATFQQELPTWEAWDHSHCESCRLVARSGDGILGFAALSPVSTRSVYAGVAEVSVYVEPECQRQGIGKALLTNLVKCSEKHGFWTLQAGIMKENEASCLLHQTCGFRVVGIREKVGRMDDGVWHDVVFMERRSQITETE